MEGKGKTLKNLTGPNDSNIPNTPLNIFTFPQRLQISNPFHLFLMLYIKISPNTLNGVG
jgi:hypothetical protein